MKFVGEKAAHAAHAQALARGNLHHARSSLLPFLFSSCRSDSSSRPSSTVPPTSIATMSIEAKEADFSTSSLNAPLDLNARRRAALAEIDNAKFGWFHVRVSSRRAVSRAEDGRDD